MKGLFWFACASLFTGGCAEYEPPGDGVAKGCRAYTDHSIDLSLALGLSSHLEWGDDEASVARRDFELEEWLSLKTAFARRDLSWRVLEPEEGVWDFEPSDTLLEAAESVGVELLGILNYGNSWARSDTNDHFFPPDDLSDFANYVRQVVERYSGRIPIYEVWNEPNAGMSFWKPVEDPDRYLELLELSSAEIRQADPEAVISLGGLFSPDLILNTPGLEFLEEILELRSDLDALVDVIAYHPYRYPFTAPEVAGDNQVSLLTHTCEMLTLMEDYGLGELPLWNTELGWHTATESITGHATEEEQAEWLVRSVVLSFSHGVERFTWYTFRDSGEDDENQEHMFGLYGYDEDPLSGEEPEPKVAAGVFAVLQSMLGENDHVKDQSEWLGLGESVYAYEISGGSQPVLVAWATEGNPVLRYPGRGKTRLTNMHGEENSIRARGGAFEVELGTSPVYLALED